MKIIFCYALEVAISEDGVDRDGVFESCLKLILFGFLPTFDAKSSKAENRDDYDDTETILKTARSVLIQAAKNK